MPDFLDRLKNALADRYAIERELMLVGWRLCAYLPGGRREPQMDAEHVAN